MTGNRLSRFVGRGLAILAGVAALALAGTASAGDRWRHGDQERGMYHSRSGHYDRGWHHGQNKHNHSHWRHHQHRHGDHDRSDWWREKRQRERAAWWRDQRRYDQRRSSWWGDRSYQAYDGGRVIDTKCPKYC
jgi:hypothetical protein